MGTEAPDVEEENIISRPSVSYDDMWAKTLLESSELEVRVLLLCLPSLKWHTLHWSLGFCIYDQCGP
jgi:hypothetical protein